MAKRWKKVQVKEATLVKLKYALDTGDLSTAREIVDDCLDMRHQERVRQAKRELYEAREKGVIDRALYDYLYDQLEDSIP